MWNGIYMNCRYVCVCVCVRIQMNNVKRQHTSIYSVQLSSVWIGQNTSIKDIGYIVQLSLYNPLVGALVSPVCAPLVSINELDVYQLVYMKILFYYPTYVDPGLQPKMDYIIERVTTHYIQSYIQYLYVLVYRNVFI